MPESLRNRPASPAIRAALLPLLALCLMALPGLAPGAHAQPPVFPGSGALVRRADFIGIVQAEPIVGSLTGPWRQMVSLSRVEAIKGSLSDALLLEDRRLLALADSADDFNNSAQFSSKGDYVAGTGIWTAFPTRFPQKGEYLVFLRREMSDTNRRRSLVIASRTGGAQTASDDGGREIYGTVALFRLETRPGADGGKPVRTVIGGTTKEQGPQALDADTVRALLLRVSESLAKNERPLAEAAEPLDRLFRQSTMLPIYLYPLGAAGAPGKADAAYETRLRAAKAQADTIRPGRTRAQVEALFPLRDGGVSVPESTRYYVGSEVMAEVPYDRTGGAEKPQNRVTGPVRLYRSRMHVR